MSERPQVFLATCIGLKTILDELIASCNGQEPTRIMRGKFEQIVEASAIVVCEASKLELK